MLVVAEDAPRLQGAGVLLAPTCRVPHAGVGEGNAPCPLQAEPCPLHPAEAGCASTSLGNWFSGRVTAGSQGSLFGASKYPTSCFAAARPGGAASAGCLGSQGTRSTCQILHPFVLFLWKNPGNPLARHPPALPHRGRGCREVFMLMRWDEIKTLGFLLVLPIVWETE